MNLAQLPDLLDSLSKLAWPVLAGIVIWKLFPGLKKIIDSRGFKIKIGDMEVTVQQANDQLRNQLEDLQRTISAQNKPYEIANTSTIPRSKNVHQILWVDDNPSNNAFEIARLKSDGYEIQQALSTSEALGILKGSDLLIDVVISDMGRNEDGRYNPKAGLDFIKQARDSEINLPIYIYTTARHAKAMRDEVKKAGGNGTTKSAIELFEMIQENPNNGMQSPPRSSGH